MKKIDVKDGQQFNQLTVIRECKHRRKGWSAAVLVRLRVRQASIRRSSESCRRKNEELWMFNALVNEK